MDDIDISTLDKRLQNELEKVGILSCRRLIEMSALEYQKLGNFTYKDVDEIKTVAANRILPISFRTAEESEIVYQNKWRTISLDCTALDFILGGGIPVRGITELSGESGVGKTQICLQLSLTVQYPVEFGGLGALAVFICTEDKFPSIRLHQMLPYFPRDSGRRSTMKNHNFADYILIDHITDLAELQNCLFKRLPSFIENSRHKVGVVIIDSIAAIFRSEYKLNEIIERANDMRIIGVQLHKLANDYNVAVLCVNQVTDACDSGTTIPALGLVWANLVTTKLQVSFAQDKIRNFKVITAPHIAPASADFIISDKGIDLPKN